ncbi:hypothetical protein C8Q80DRAFT_1110679 [Daedaleopsis nitida]|nr:hypothetical protein C8Q80DRAFT_1110679 [Daedaleopsis nitida]
MTISITTNTQFGYHTSAEEVAAHLAPHIAGKTILVTGVTPGGLGAHFIEVTAPYKPKIFIFAGRNPSQLLDAASAITTACPEIATRVLELDLSSQASVRKAAAEVLSWPEPIDILMNNAGVMATPYQKTVDGLEFQFGTNHIGHFLFTALIADKLIQSKVGARVVNVSSSSHRLSPIRWDDVQFSEGETYHKWRAYGQSKTANILFTLSLAEKLGLSGVKAFSLHPGTITTNLGRFTDLDADIACLREIDIEMGNPEGYRKVRNIKTLTQGTATHVVAALDPKLADYSGVYLQDCQLGSLKPYAADKDAAEKLWRLSEEIVGQTFSWKERV